MKIAHITIYPPRNQKHSNDSGVASYTKNLVTSMGHKPTDSVFVLCNKIDGVAETYQEDTVKVIRCFDRKPIFFSQLYKQLKITKPDVVHIQQELSLFGNILTAYLLQWLVLLIRASGSKVTITLHGVVSLKQINKKFVEDNNSRLPVLIVKLAFFVIYKPLCIFSNKVIVHEELFKEILVEEYRCSGEKIMVINHGVEDFLPTPKQDACQKLNIDTTKDILLYMGYLTGYKGIDLLIEGFHEYSKTNRNSFLIIGAGKHPKLKNDEEYLKEYTRLENKAASLLEQGSYRWVGFIEEKDISTYYSAADVSLYPYSYILASSGPMSIAIGHGKPFLVSSVFRDVIRNPNLVFEKTPESMSAAISNLFLNKKDFEEIADQMKKDRLWVNVARMTYDVYKSTKTI